MFGDMHQSWKTALAHELGKEYVQQLMIDIQADYLVNDPPIYPPAPLLFHAFNFTPLNKVNVVILGQDPYHGAGQAMGLAFSVPDGVTIPPSLRNIYKEIESDLGVEQPASGNLTNWAKQGVLLLNTTLTVEEGKAGSHQGRGWEQFTDMVITTISEEREHVVFMLWGAHAAKKADLIDEGKHLILTAPHPSALSAHRGFFGCRHFSQCNEYLKNHAIEPIAWSSMAQ